MSKKNFLKTTLSGPRQNAAIQDSPVVLTPSCRVIANQLELTLLLPTHQQMNMTIDPFSTFADLKREIRTVLAMHDSHSVVLSRRVGRMRGWERVDQADSDVLILKLSNRGTYRIDMIENVDDDQTGLFCGSYDVTQYTNSQPFSPANGPLFQDRRQPSLIGSVYSPEQQHKRHLTENQDEEFAMRLTLNECRVHHEKMEMEKMIATSTTTNSRAVTPPPASCNTEETMESFGKVVVRGTVSQYRLRSGGGQSSCTSIALVGAKHILLLDHNVDTDPLESISPATLDMIVETGVSKHNMSASGHSNVEDLWTSPIFEDTVASLQRGQRIEACVGFEGFHQAIERAWKFSVMQQNQNSTAVAVVVTKPPETVLCFSYNGETWYLLDSHGESHATNKVAYIMQFTSIMTLALALEIKYPALSGAENDLTVRMYNSFEATPIAAVQGTRSIDDTEAKQAYAIDSASPALASSAPPLADETCDTLPDTSPPQSTPPPRAQPQLDMEMFKCAYTLVIMADPVVCVDGHTYERSSIEQHFQTRRDEEEKRLREERGEENEADDSPTCGGPRSVIQLTSPMTGAVVSDLLVPNLFVERQIVDLVEANVLEMTDEELADWQNRRKQKRVKDRQRAEEDQRIREEQERMQRNREEGLRRREEEARAMGRTSDSLLTNASGPRSQLVRLERPTGHRLSDDDLGISVALCDESSWIELEYLWSTCKGGGLRCMMSCCASLLRSDEINWCYRCGRIACSTCLGFQVTDIVAASSSELHNVCGECVMQILDVMPREELLGQRRASIEKLRLQPYLSELSARAIDAQDIQARQTAEENFGPDIHKLEEDNRALRNTQMRLQTQFEEAESRATEARHDDGATSTQDTEASEEDEAVEWEETVADLQGQYDELLKKSPDQEMDEDAQFAHFQAMSDITYRLEEAQASLAEVCSRRTEPSRAMSRKSSSAKDKGGNGGAHTETPLPPETTTDMSIADLELTCNTLQRLHDDLQAETVPEDADDSMLHIQAISTVMSRFEQAQEHLIEARSRLDAGQSVSTALENLSNLINRFVDKARSAGTKAQPKAIKRPRGLRRLFSASMVNEPQPSDLFNPQVSQRLDELLDATRKCVTASSLEHRQTGVESVLDALTQLSEHVESINKSQVQGLHQNAVQDARTLLKACNAQKREKEQVNNAAGRVPGDKISVDLLSLEELQSEFLQLSSAVQHITDIDEITVAMIRLTEIEQVLHASQTEFVEADVSTQTEFVEADVSTASQVHVAADLDFLKFLGNSVVEDWPLPLGLEYPTSRMQNELELLRNTLADRMLQSERKYDHEFSERRGMLTEEKEQLEDQIQSLRSRVETAQASAEAEQQRLEERRERHRQEEAERRERERRRLQGERRLRREREELERKHKADEDKTMEAFRNAVGREGNARMFGENGDMRMCKICKAGPVFNKDCADLKTHNDNSTTYKGSTVARTDNPNHCPNCGHFEENWHNWLPWDGIEGPH